MKKDFKVKELQKIEKDKKDEHSIKWKAIFESEDSNDTLVLASEKPLGLNKEDEVELKLVAHQKKLKE